MIYFVSPVPQRAGKGELDRDLADLWEVERLRGAEDLWEPPVLKYIVEESKARMGGRIPFGSEQSRLCLLACYGREFLSEDRPRVVGYAAWEDRPRNTDLLSVAVHPDHRRQGLGRWLLAELSDLLQRQMGLAKPDRTNPARKLLAKVRARRIEDQLFLKACGFTCYKSEADAFDNPPDDRYKFRLQLSPCPKPNQVPDQ